MNFGFSMANRMQLLGLLASHGFDFDSSGGPSGGFTDVSSVNNLERYPSFVVLFSETNAQKRKTGEFIDRCIGVVGDAFQTPLIKINNLETEATVIMSIGTDIDFSTSGLGNWLLRPTSLPTVYAALDFGDALGGLCAQDLGVL